MATKMQQTKEDRRAMEVKMSDRIQEMEAKMKQMNKPAQVVKKKLPCTMLSLQSNSQQATNDNSFLSNTDNTDNMI